MKKRKQVTLIDVAKTAGVSRQTVSRVINEKGNVATETAQRVENVIAELGYQPTPIARGLAQQRTNSIGLVIPYTSDLFFADPHLMRFICGVDHIAGQHNVSLTLATALAIPGLASQPTELSAYQRLINAAYVDGVIVVETATNQAGIALLEENAYPWVMSGYAEGDQRQHTIHADDYGGARQAMMHLLSLGHRHIGLIGAQAHVPKAFEKRMAGCRQTMHDHNLTLNPDLITYGDMSLQSGYRAAMHLMANPTPPTAIFAFNDRMGTGAMKYLQAHGWKIPEQVSVIGFDDIPIAEMMSLTTVRQPSLDMGHQTTRMLFELIEERTAVQEIVLPTELIVRESTITVHHS